MTTEVRWAPQQGPQEALIACPIFEVFYGGARGGGKTDGALGKWLIHAQKYGENARGLMVRRSFPQLADIIERGKQLFCPDLAEWKVGAKDFVFHNGALLRLRHLENDGDAENYQGHSYTMVLVEEITNFPFYEPLAKLKATLRSTAGVPTQFIATGNPGGPGHLWVKQRYIDPNPTGYDPVFDPDGMPRVFIPARVRDNRLLLEADPQYVAKLKQVGSVELVRAWLEGDWEVVQGAYFDNFRVDRHVLRAFELPAGLVRGRAFDWGSARPFCCLWFAVSDGTFGYPRGALVFYREWYGAAGPNQGLKMAVEDVARGIMDRETGETMDIEVADPAIFSQDGGPSMAERMHTATDGKINWMRADNERVGGWNQLRARLDGMDDRPMLYIMDNCRDLIRTLPTLQHGDRKPEDLDTEGEDHAADAARYACMARPWSPPVEWTPPPRFKRTFNEEVLAHLDGQRKGGFRSVWK